MHQPETRILQREAVSSALSDALSRFPLVVLAAPMGYGKTTAARELARVFPRRSFYVTIPSATPSPFYLWDKCCKQAIAQESRIASTLQRMGFPADPVQTQRVIDRLGERIAGHPTLLVIDDYHFVDAPEVDAFIEALTREAIPDLKVLLLSITRPRLPLEELRIKGLAAQFGHDLLTFTKDDAASYFTLNGVRDEGAANAAWALSEGWAAALWLTLQSFLASGILGSARDMEAIIAGTVFSRYGMADKKLLLQLSIFDSFTPRQAAAVSGDDAAPRRLRVLHDQNAFMTFDAATDRYRLHSIFRSFLERLLSEREDEAAKDIDIRALFHRAGEWYAFEGDTLQAIRSFFRAGTDEDYLRILQLCEKPGDGLLTMFDPEGFSRIMEAIPWAVRCRCPLGYVSFVYYYISRVDPGKGLALLKEAEREFARAKGIPASLRRRIRGEIEMTYAGVDFNDVFAMVKRYKTAHPLLGGRSAIFHRHMTWTFGCPHFSFLYLREPGQYDAFVDLIENDMIYYQEITNGCGTGGQDLAHAEVCMERGMLKRAEPFVMKAAYRGHTKEQAATQIAVHFTLARLALARGANEDEALDALRELAPKIALAGNLLLANSLDCSVGYIAAVRGKIELIPGWIRRGDLSAGPSLYQGSGFTHIVHGKALAAAGEWAALEAFAQDLPGYLGKYNTLMGQIHTCVMRAIAARQLYGDDDAKPHIRKALELARPDKIALIIAEYGAHIPPLLQLADVDPADTFTAAIRKLNAVYARPAKHGVKSLAPREAAVLELAVDGKNNNEIAAILGIKPVTVGNTLSRVYKKLGAQNRTEAAAIWRNG